MNLAARIARRELRGGLKGFRIFLACLALGVAAIAAVGTLRAAIQSGLEDQGAILLGGDAQMEFTYRFADADERRFMDSVASKVSETVDFRSMAAIPEDSALTQIKAVDDAYPLYGEVILDPAIPLAEALATRDGLPGAVMDPVLISRLSLAVGDRFALGSQEFRLTAALIREPDSASAGFTLGPRTILRTDALANSGLLAAGSLYETRYRLALPPSTSLESLKTEATDTFRDKGMRWLDSRQAAPGVETFVDRIGSFLVLVGLAGLAVGGVGVSAAVRAYLEGKIPTIATLKTIGADGRLIFRIYLIQILALSAIGIGIGLLLGAGAPLLLAPVIEAQLPFPAEIALAPMALLEAAFYGLLTALLFTLWPLARTEKVRAAALYRGMEGRGNRPRGVYLWAILGTGLLLIGSAVALSGIPELAFGAAGGIVGALLILTLAAYGLRRAAQGVVRILVDLPELTGLDQPVALGELVDEATDDAFWTFMLDRTRFVLEQRGYDVRKRPEFFYKGSVQGSPPQYSQEFADWLVR
ncbi:MAG: FtsX-like permease family protein [Tabrizicola sp.]|nr:FtsX-like permease family protein [Tabrizicola sp.]